MLSFTGMCPANLKMGGFQGIILCCFPGFSSGGVFRLGSQGNSGSFTKIKRWFPRRGVSRSSSSPVALSMGGLRMPHNDLLIVDNNDDQRSACTSIARNIDDAKIRRDIFDSVEKIHD